MSLGKPRASPTHRGWSRAQDDLGAAAPLQRADCTSHTHSSVGPGWERWLLRVTDRHPLKKQELPWLTGAKSKISTARQLLRAGLAPAQPSSSSRSFYLQPGRHRRSVGCPQPAEIAVHVSFPSPWPPLAQNPDSTAPTLLHLQALLCRRLLGCLLHAHSPCERR